MNSTNNITDSHGATEGIHLVKFQLHHLEVHVLLICFILSIVILKVVLQRTPYISRLIPESCLLLTLGLVFGAILKFSFTEGNHVTRLLKLDSNIFFMFLLPPIVLEAAYGLHSHAFYTNFLKILLFAVLGTLLNSALITGCLCIVRGFSGVSSTTGGMTVMQIALFSSFIVAVDPVAVLAIFQEIGVNLSLYFLVFGESLFNDAVTIVLYNIMEAFNRQQDGTITAWQVLLGVCSFFTISLGGLLVGALWGVLACLITRITDDHQLETIEPLTVLLTAYCAYVFGDLFGWSGLIGLMACGLIQSAYTFHNICNKSVITVKRTVKMLAQLSESAIFLFLGMEFFNDSIVWEWSFILWVMFFSLMARALVIPLLCLLVNYLTGVDPSKRISFRNQVIMVYGGLRGAVAYALATTIPLDALQHHEDPARLKGMFLSSTLFVVLITNLLMGTTMKPLVRLLHIKSAPDEHWSIFEEMNQSMMVHNMSAIEVIIDFVGTNTLIAQFRRLDERILRKVLMREPVTHDEKIVRMYEKVSMALHLATVRPDHSSEYLEKVPKNLHSLPTIPSRLDMAELVNVVRPAALPSPLKVLSPEHLARKTPQPSYDLPSPRTISLAYDRNLFRQSRNMEALRLVNLSRYDDSARRYGEAIRRRGTSMQSVNDLTSVDDADMHNAHRDKHNLTVTVSQSRQQQDRNYLTVDASTFRCPLLSSSNESPKSKRRLESICEPTGGASDHEDSGSEDGGSKIKFMLGNGDTFSSSKPPVSITMHRNTSRDFKNDIQL